MRRWNFYLLVQVPHGRTLIFSLSLTCQEDLSTCTQPRHLEGRKGLQSWVFLPNEIKVDTTLLSWMKMSTPSTMHRNCKNVTCFQNFLNPKLEKRERVVGQIDRQINEPTGVFLNHCSRVGGTWEWMIGWEEKTQSHTCQVRKSLKTTSQFKALTLFCHHWITTRRPRKQRF